MYFRKFRHPANFAFIERAAGGRARLGAHQLTVSLDRFEGGVFRLRAESPVWGRNLSMAGLTPPRKVAGGDLQASLDASCALTIADAAGRVLLRAPQGNAIGVSGESSLFVFEHQPGDRFYGMGEKLLGLELSGKQSKFWNTDAFGDFHWKEISEDRPDPYYASIPYLILQRGTTWIGLLLDNPHATFFNTGADTRIGGDQLNLGAPPTKTILAGAERGQPDLYILVAGSLAELTRKLQGLVGHTPMPPVWALGYHQCRWGYKSAEELLELDRQFRKHGIPCDGLWIDIDYMQDYKVFTFREDYFPDLAGALKKLAENGRRMVPILDPGVKRLPGYDIYDDGRKHDVFCRNPQGLDFIGLVWPGETAFPDFSREDARAWWAGHVQQFAKPGIQGAWIDMNDPSTGGVQNDAMLFDKGRQPHDAFHNQYALGMAMATRAGFQAAHPDQRPFVISRSGFTGMAKHSAIWTGDNVANYHYLRLSIPCSINLALSGVPFNGPDIGGFAGSTSAQLLIDWQKAGFLFPFCRNHAAAIERRKEPWAYDAKTLRTVTHYIRMRYKLRPYLYNLFIRQESDGDAILRPLFYDFAETPDLPLGKIEDQFLMGPAILQAPIVWEKAKARDVVLPGPAHWWSVLDRRWIRGPRKVKARPGPLQTPLYVREGSIVPMEPGEPRDARYDGSRIEAHVFLRNKLGAKAAALYAFDDGETWQYRSGQRTEIALNARVEGGVLHLDTDMLADGYGPARVRFVLYAPFKRILVNGKPAKAKRTTWVFCGSRQTVWSV